MPPTHDFPLLPPGFRFGTSTASYQIEGAVAEDGRGPSIWDTFTAQPGTVVDGSSGEVACDHYHRVDEDVALMKELGTGGYRFSIAWPRIQPTGRGPANEKGLAFYDRLIDTLLEHGQQPMVTLYHWDLPQALEDDGGWLNRDTVDRFAEYAAIVGERFADRVEHWIPVNEPNVASVLGYGMGTHAPGKKLLFDFLPAAHHLLLAHGRAAIELRRAGATSIGCANNHAPIWPASDDDADVGMSKIFDALWNGMFLEPMLLGRYPADLMPLFEDVMEDGDLATIRQPLDFYGVNYYNPMRVAAADEDSDIPFDVPRGRRLPHHRLRLADRARTRCASGWSCSARASAPPCRRSTSPSRAAATTPAPTSTAWSTTRPASTTCAPTSTPSPRRSRAASTSAATTAGRSWTTSSGPRATPSASACVHVDYETLERTRKNSFHWYADLIAAQPQHL